MPRLGSLSSRSLTGQGISVPVAIPIGQTEFTTAGVYFWTAPTGVTSVSVVAVGAGGYNASTNLGQTGGGGGGALAYKNNITVVPGQSYKVVVGRSYNGGTGGSTKFTAGFGSIIAGGGEGQPTFNVATPTGGAGGVPSGVYDAGYAGGAGGSYTATSQGFGGGGGAGGYSGVGGNGGSDGGAGSSSTGGGGGGGGSFSGTNTTRGGGVGIYGAGSNGSGGSGSGGGGATGGGHGGIGSGGNGNPLTPQQYGGGGTGWNGGFSALGGNGAARIIWGTGRAYPSTGTADSGTTVTPVSGVFSFYDSKNATLPTTSGTFTASNNYVKFNDGGTQITAADTPSVTITGASSSGVITIEAWRLWTAAPGSFDILFEMNIDANNYVFVDYGGTIRGKLNGSNFGTSSKGWTPLRNTWEHYVLTIDLTARKVVVAKNGAGQVLPNDVSSFGSFVGTPQTVSFKDSLYGGYAPYYIDDLRVSSSDVYSLLTSSTYTVPTTALTVTASTLNLIQTVGRPS